MAGIDVWPPPESEDDENPLSRVEEERKGCLLVVQQ